jgi:hypothetical protein
MLHIYHITHSTISAHNHTAPSHITLTMARTDVPIEEVIREINSPQSLAGDGPKFMIVQYSNPTLREHELLTREFRIGTYTSRFYRTSIPNIYYMYKGGSGSLVNQVVIDLLGHKNFIFSKIYTHCSE